VETGSDESNGEDIIELIERGAKGFGTRDDFTK
jgi:hypothetical protein